jgi:hypothetical protein
MSHIYCVKMKTCLLKPVQLKKRKGLTWMLHELEKKKTIIRYACVIYIQFKNYFINCVWSRERNFLQGKTPQVLIKKSQGSELVFIDSQYTCEIQQRSSWILVSLSFQLVFSSLYIYIYIYIIFRIVNNHNLKISYRKLLQVRCCPN